MRKEITIAKTDSYRVYRSGKTYVIEYAERDPMGPLPWYSTIAAVKEALYYAGLLESKTAKLGA